MMQNERNLIKGFALVCRIELMIISGFQKTSFIDYSDKIASLIFTQGCNLNCFYCHNKQLIPNIKTSIVMQEEILTFLEKRKGLIDGVVITGGEPTIQTGLISFAEKIKALGYKIKLDTNGTNPEILNKLINLNLIDYIAMDIKAPFFKYSEITRVQTPIEFLSDSVNIIMKSKIDYEFRTTVVKKYLKQEDILAIAQSIKGAKLYFLQKCNLNNSFIDFNYSEDELINLSALCSKFVQQVKCR